MKNLQFLNLGLKDGYYSDVSQCDRYYLCKNETIFSENLCPDGLGNIYKLKY